MNHTFKLSLAAAAFCSFSAVAAAQGQGGVIGPAPAAPAGYWAAKAQCWSDLSTAERSQGDTHGTPITAAGNAERIHAALLAGTEPGTDVELPIFAQKFLPAEDKRYGRPKWRADILYIDSIVDQYKAKFCRTPKLGCLEIAQASVYENMEETKGARWNHGRPEIDLALDLAHQAENQFAAACAPKQVEEIPALIYLPLEVIQLPADTLFRFDKGDAKGLLPGGLGAIEAVASKVKSHGQRAGKIEIIGYTDRLGKPSYNVALSQRRAATVGSLLKAAGVTLQIQTVGLGEENPVTGDTCKTFNSHAALIDCLQPDRRVVLRILPSGK